MGGESSSSQQQTIARAPTIGGAELQGILTGMGSIDPNLSGAETGALSRLQASADRGSPFAAGLTGAANQALVGGPQVLQDTLAGKFLDPNSNPFFGATTSRIADLVRERVGAAGAGMGRDIAGSGNFLGLGDATTNALAPYFMQQYNNERGNQFQAAGLDLANRTAGFDFANKAQQANDFGALQTMAIEAQRRGIPLQTYLAQAGVALPAANAFATQTGNTTGTQQMSGAEQFQKIASGTGSLLGGFRGLWAPPAPVG